MDLDPCIWWIIAGMVFIIVEFFVPIMLALSLTIGCLAGCICCLFEVEPVWQFVIAAAISIMASFILFPLFKKWNGLDGKKGKSTRTGMDALLGRRAVLSEEITPAWPGRGQIDGDSWPMYCATPGETIPAGTEVTVVGYKSIILLVEACRSEPPKD